MTTTITCAGECMLELRSVGGGLLALGYAGDTYNTAYYLANSGADLHVEYATVLGTDHTSDDMLRTFAADGVGSAYVARTSDRHPGLYLIDVDEYGERSFTYYRSDSAARTLFSADYAARYGEAIAASTVFYYSGITLSILTPEAQDRLLDTAARARRRGALVVFDSNYRPQSWASADVTRDVYARAYRNVDIALPSFDDERALFGDVSPAACADRIAAYGVREVVVKNGVKTGAWRGPGEARGTFTPTPSTHVVDTTGAGDSYNAGYLAARLTGASIAEACTAGAELSRRITEQRGAIQRPLRESHADRV